MTFGEIVLGPRAPRRARAGLVRGIAAARLTFEVDLGLRIRAAALAFEAVDTPAGYDELLAGIVEDNGATPARAADAFGYSWLILTGGDLEDLAISISIVAESFERAGTWDQLACAVLAFEPPARASAAPVYLVYNLARSTFYVFVPRGDRDRDSAGELRVRRALARELRLEPDRQRWYPLWDIPVQGF